MHERGSAALVAISQHNALLPVFEWSPIWLLQGRVADCRKLPLFQLTDNPTGNNCGYICSSIQDQNTRSYSPCGKLCFWTNCHLYFCTVKIFSLANANAIIVEHGKQKTYVASMKRAAISIFERSWPKQPVHMVHPCIQASALFLP